MAKRGNPNFKKGQSGNPAGKPKGRRNDVTILLEKNKGRILELALEQLELGNITIMSKLLDKAVPTLTEQNLKVSGTINLRMNPKIATKEKENGE